MGRLKNHKPMEQFYTEAEKKLFLELNDPKKIQDYLNSIPVNFELKGETCRSARMVLEKRQAHCMEGAMLAAAVLEFHGHKPLVLDLRTIKPHDNDHVVALFKQSGRWGAISKTNHAVLRFREPIFKTIRELALSYFHEYFLDNGKKTLREYSEPVDLNRFNNLNWRTTDKDLFAIPRGIDRARHFPILLPGQARQLRKADKVEIAAGKLVEWKK